MSSFANSLLGGGGASPSSSISSSSSESISRSFKLREPALSLAMEEEVGKPPSEALRLCLDFFEGMMDQWVNESINRIELI